MFGDTVIDLLAFGDVEKDTLLIRAFDACIRI